MNDQKNQPFAARLKYAWSGLRHAVRAERSLRLQLLLLAGALAALLYLRPAPLWWALVLLVSSAVLAAELINTAIERLADLVHPETHAQVRIVKDCAAGAVLLLAIGALGVAVALAVDLWRTR